MRSLYCDPWEKQGLVSGTQQLSVTCLKWLLARFHVSFEAWFVELCLEEQSQHWRYFNRICTSEQRLAFLVFLPK